jgi:hypothetical protein
MISLVHNFDKNKFMWLFCKYAYVCNPSKHCTNAIRDWYGKKFSKNNPEFLPGTTIVFDEYDNKNWDAIYICGVSKNGYRAHSNYPHNVHAAIIPQNGASDQWEFENWRMNISNGVFERIPTAEEIPQKYLTLDKQYWTCRMFRWAVNHYAPNP